MRVPPKANQNANRWLRPHLGALYSIANGIATADSKKHTAWHVQLRCNHQEWYCVVGSARTIFAGLPGLLLFFNVGVPADGQFLASVH